MSRLHRPPRHPWWLLHSCSRGLWCWRLSCRPRCPQRPPFTRSGLLMVSLAARLAPPLWRASSSPRQSLLRPHASPALRSHLTPFLSPLPLLCSQSRSAAWALNQRYYQCNSSQGLKMCFFPLWSLHLVKTKKYYLFHVSWEYSWKVDWLFLAVCHWILGSSHISRLLNLEMEQSRRLLWLSLLHPLLPCLLLCLLPGPRKKRTQR